MKKVNEMWLNIISIVHIIKKFSAGVCVCRWKIVLLFYSDTFKGSSISEVNILGKNGGQRFCDGSTRVYKQRDYEVEGVSKLCDVIYARPLSFFFSMAEM